MITNHAGQNMVAAQKYGVQKPAQKRTANRRTEEVKYKKVAFLTTPELFLADTGTTLCLNS
jgi:hypothetical protein